MESRLGEVEMARIKRAGIGRAVLLAFVVIAGGAASAGQTSDGISLRYGFRAGDLLEYHTRVTWAFDASNTHNAASFEGGEMLLGLAGDAAAGTLRVALLPAGLALRDQRIHSRTLAQSAADTEDVDRVFFARRATPTWLEGRGAVDAFLSAADVARNPTGRSFAR